MSGPRVLHVADFLPGLHEIAGGAEYAALRAIELQAERGVEVSVATSVPSKGRPSASWASFHPLPTSRLGAKRPGYLLKQLLVPHDPVAARAFSRVLAEVRPDVVHFHNLHTLSLSLPLAARARRVAVVLSVYDYWLVCPTFMLETGDRGLCAAGHGARCGPCIGRRRLGLLRHATAALFAFRPAVFSRPIAAVDRFHVLSEASGRLLARHGVRPEAVRAVPLLLWQEAAVRPRGPFEPGRLLYAGWIERRKGLLVAVEALARIAARRPDAQLVVLGMPADPAYHRDVLDRIRAGGLEGRVHFRGSVGRDELVDELQRAHVVLVPEQWENMSPVILSEAMAAGACVVASRVGGIPDFVNEGVTGLLAERDDPADWAARVLAALEDPPGARRMGAAARELARAAFAPDVVFRGYRELYRELIETRSEA
jgi:glycosyltransferase involved in cell wall biosynthesis